MTPLGIIRSYSYGLIPYGSILVSVMPSRFARYKVLHVDHVRAALNFHREWYVNRHTVAVVVELRYTLHDALYVATYLIVHVSMTVHPHAVMYRVNEVGFVAVIVIANKMPPE